MHFRASYEEIGINNAAFMEYLTGDVCNFIRLKVVCRYVTKEGIYNGILVRFCSVVRAYPQKEIIC